MNARTMASLASILLTACAGPAVSPPTPGTTYEITITRSWSEATNPLDWPGVSGPLHRRDRRHAQRCLRDVRRRAGSPRSASKCCRRKA